MPAKEKPGKQQGKHVDPHAQQGGTKQREEIPGITPIQVPEKFVSPCHWQPALPAPATSVFSTWGGQVPSNFLANAEVTFFGGGGATRSFESSVAGESEDIVSSPTMAINRLSITLPDLRSEREVRLNIPLALVSRDTSNDDVVIHRLDAVPLDAIKVEDFYSLLTETSFVKRESMIKKEQQRARGDMESFLDGEPVDVPSQYKTMLDRIVAHLDHTGAEEKALELPAVRVEGAGRRTVWVNFQEICKTLSRTAEEVRAFVCNELTTTSKYDGENRLHIDVSRLTVAKLQKLVTDYALSHVYCTSCHSFDTKLVRDAALRLDLVVCNKCESKRSVENQSGGFTAIVNRKGRLRAKALA